jgi:hypothetical protein
MWTLENKLGIDPIEFLPLLLHLD